MDTAALAEGIRAALAGAVPDVAGVGDVRRLPGGASRETWSFTVRRVSGATDRFVLRRDPPGAPPSGLAMEAALLHAAAGAGVPVPAVVAAGDATAGLGSAFVIMAFVEGETIPRRILRDEQWAGARAVLTEQCAAALAAVHRIPLDAVPGLPGGDPVALLRALLDRLGQAHPAFELALRWLEGNRPPPSPPAVVHGDFRNGNLIVGPEGIRAVLDWELAHVGDPVEDLGWLCVKAWRFGAPAEVGGFGSIDELLHAYRRAGGGDVALATLRWWQVLGTLRWGIICIVQAMTHMAGAVRSVELAAIGRRVCEVEWDLLELLP